MKRREKYRELQGVITIEMAYLMPIVFMVFVLVMYTAFYYHDKQILIGAASETAVVGAQRERIHKEESNLEWFCKERVNGKLILFAEVKVMASTTKEWVDVDIYAKKRKMNLHIRQRAPIVNPEKKIRRKQILEKYMENTEDE